MWENWRKKGERALAWLRELSSAKRLSFAAMVLAAFDTFIYPISLTALGLLALACLPWLIPLVRSSEWPLKSMKLPGGLEFEFNELEQIGANAKSAGLLKPAKQKYSFEAIFDQDPNLAMAGLRIELERRLLELGQIARIDITEKGLSRLVRSLEEVGTLDRREVSVIADLLPTMNKAVHAQDLDMRVFGWAMETGPQLLAGLDAKIQNIRESYS